MKFDIDYKTYWIVYALVCIALILDRIFGI